MCWQDLYHSQLYEISTLVIYSLYFDSWWAIWLYSIIFGSYLVSFLVSDIDFPMFSCYIDWVGTSHTWNITQEGSKEQDIIQLSDCMQVWVSVMAGQWVQFSYSINHKNKWNKLVIKLLVVVAFIMIYHLRTEQRELLPKHTKLQRQYFFCDFLCLTSGHHYPQVKA